jgi:hypothetical protein
MEHMIERVDDHSQLYVANAKDPKPPFFLPSTEGVALYISAFDPDVDGSKKAAAARSLQFAPPGATPGPTSQGLTDMFLNGNTDGVGQSKEHIAAFVAMMKWGAAKDPRSFESSVVRPCTQDF